MPDEHVFARVSGHGLTIFPRAPFRYRRTADGLQLHHDGPGGSRSAWVTPEGGDRYGVRLASGTSALVEVADVVAGPARDDWWIETTEFMVRWPDGYALVSRPSPPGYDLLGEEGALVYPQGPFGGALPPDERFAAPGQRLAAKGVLAGSTRWIGLVYEHEGRAWTQRHYLVPLGGRTVLVTLQAPSARVGSVLEAAEALVLSVRPFEGDARPLTQR